MLSRISVARSAASAAARRRTVAARSATAASSLSTSSRSQQAAPTAPAASAAATSSSPSSSTESRGEHGQILPLSRMSGSSNNRGARRTLLPTPLPEHVVDAHAEALRRAALRKRPTQNKRILMGQQHLQQELAHQQLQLDQFSLSDPSSSSTSSASSFSPSSTGQLSFGDLSSATLHALDDEHAIFPPSKSLESISILKACISTGMVGRANKIFSDVRAEASYRAAQSSYAAAAASASSSADDNNASLRQAQSMPPSPLDVETYNAMLLMYLSQAWREDGASQRSVWVQRTWDLFTHMESGVDADGNITADPQPNEATVAILAKGIVRMMRTNRYPSKHQGLTSLLASVRRLGIDLHEVVTSPYMLRSSSTMEHLVTRRGAGGREMEPDARMVLQYFVSAAADAADVAASTALDRAARTLEEQQQQATAAEREMRQNSSGDDDAEDTADTTIDEMTPLRPVQARSRKTGEEEVPINLQLLQENLSVVHEARSTFSDPYERQKWLEESALEAAKKRLAFNASNMEELGLHNAGKMQSRQLQEWMWDWFKKLETRLEEDLETMRQRESKRTSYGNRGVPTEIDVLPFLQLVPPSTMALTSVLVLMRMMGTGGVSHGIKTTMALLSVGKGIENEYHLSLTRNHPEIFTNAKQAHEALRKRGLLDREARRNLRQWQRQQGIESGTSSAAASTAQWSQSVRAKVGSFLVQQLMDVATVVRKGQDRDGVQWVENQPAFYSAYQYMQGKKLGVIRANEVVSKRLDRESMTETFHARHLPMLVPPRLWLTHDSGGYLSMKTSAMRYKDSAEQGSYLREASDNHHLETVLAGLDVLGSTPWIVNDKVLKVMTEVWNEGTDVAEMPPLEATTKEPERPVEYETDLKARATYLAQMKLYRLERANNHSQRCDVNYKLEIARAFTGERFYFPHNMDFRGRAYPIPPHLNHMGNDLCRGLLMFADAKPLGKSGLRWLRIHLANVFGYDKASFAEREQFAIDHEADVRAAVADPLAVEEGAAGRWWLQADDPWQCLATCFDLVAALDHPEGPEAYASHLPVHQDGTCNGLQHYAALGGDLAGAKQVNLSQGERPSDVYTGVADLVIAQLANDAAVQVDEGSDSHAAETSRMARILKDKVTRKVVKQTVMTTVYGVTFIGAKNQVQRQLADRGDIPHEDLWSCASYLAKVIMNCIGDLFTGAEMIQHWLHDSAFLIAKSIPPARVAAIDHVSPNVNGNKIANAEEDEVVVVDAVDDVPKKVKAKALDQASRREQMTSVIWTTPLDLPVVQPYRKVTRKQVMTAMRSVYLHDPQTNTQVSPPKQASAFPPNFIHSLDATHMMLTALECRHIDLTFAAVHDSYWTHASDIDTMSELIRDTFVRLHSRDLLGELREEFLERYRGFRVPREVAEKLQKRRETRAAKRGESVVDKALVNDAERRELLAEEGEEDEELDAEGASLEMGGGSSDGIESDVEVDAAEESVKASEEEGQGTPPKKEKRKRRSKKSSSSDDLSHFVDLGDALPPIPTKGSFDVKETRNSLYFFS